MAEHIRIPGAGDIIARTDNPPSTNNLNAIDSDDDAVEDWNKQTPTEVDDLPDVSDAEELPDISDTDSPNMQSILPFEHETTGSEGAQSRSTPDVTQLFHSDHIRRPASIEIRPDDNRHAPRPRLEGGNLDDHYPFVGLRQALLDAGMPENTDLEDIVGDEDVGEVLADEIIANSAAVLGSSLKVHCMYTPRCSRSGTLS